VPELQRRSRFGFACFCGAVAAYRGGPASNRASLAGCAAALALAIGCLDPSLTEAPANFDLQGHRGARGLAPENTLPSFERALDLEVTTLELDLHFSADDALIVWHDPVISPSKCGLARGGDGSRPDPDRAPPAALAVRRLSRAQLAGYRCDRNPEPDRFAEQRSTPTLLAGDDYRIVELFELFDFVERYAASAAKTHEQRRAAARVRFNIETKREAEHPGHIGDGFDGQSAGPLEREFERLVRARGLETRVTLQSFDHRSLWSLRALGSPIELVALTESTADLDALKRRGAAAWSPWHEEVDAESLARAHALGLRVVPWTVNDAERMRELRALGVDGIITDRPDLAR
jgi:glycerophosphoryl diester phosphodiesterase